MKDDEPPPITPKHIEYREVEHGLVLLVYPVAGEPTRLFIPRQWFPQLITVLNQLIRMDEIRVTQHGEEEGD